MGAKTYEKFRFPGVLVSRTVGRRKSFKKNKNMIIQECDYCGKKVVQTGEKLNEESLTLYEVRAYTKIKLPWGHVCFTCRNLIVSTIEKVKNEIWSKYERTAVEKIKAELALQKIRT